MYALYRTTGTERQLLGWYADQLAGAVAMDIYRQTFDDNAELILEREGQDADRTA